MTTNNSTFTTVSSGRASSAGDRVLGQARSRFLENFFDEVTYPRSAQEASTRLGGYSPSFPVSDTQRYYEDLLNDTGRWPDYNDRVNVAQNMRADSSPLWYERALDQVGNTTNNATKGVKDLQKAHAELSGRVSELERALDQKDVTIETLEAAVQEQGQLLNKLVRLLSKMKGESYVAGN